MNVTFSATTVIAGVARALTLASAAACAAHAAPSVPLDRTVLPIPEPAHAPITEIDVRKVQPPPRFEVTPPAGAPNVVIVLIDDMGFGQPSAFGGGIHMPTLERISKEGLRYSNFHTAALCSPTRAALLTGRNHHTNNTGAVQDVATAFPGQTGKRPPSVAPLAEILRLNGYSTGAFGKWHLTPLWETSTSGPFDLWPTRSGFEKYYGFIGGEANQWAPLLYDGTLEVEMSTDPKYHVTTDLANRAIQWVRAQKSLTPDRPFFLYFAPGATHAPHHVGKEWADKYEGRFDSGWDVYRAETLARQIELGVVPPGTKLAPKPAAVQDWATLSEDEKRLFARQMEVYAGFAEHTDHEVGRLVAALEDLGVMDDTLFLYIAGDNGASAEGGPAGMFNEMSFFNGVPEALPDVVAKLDEWGGPSTFPHYAIGWAVAGNAPCAYAKQVASDCGAMAPMAVRWPKRIAAKGEARMQFHHVVDVAPTVLKLAGIPEPLVVNGAKQKPMEGASFAYTFAAPNAEGRRTTQYFEIAGNRAIYHDGWFARTVHRAPWERQPRATLDQDEWELYDRDTDFSLANDLAAEHPEKLAELQALFLEEAVKYDVLPIDDRSIERLDPSVAGRPDLMAGRTKLTLYDGMTGMLENAFINVKNRSKSITAELELPAAGASGVVLAQAGRFGGWSLYFQAGRPAYAYNWIGRETYTVAATEPVPAGRAEVRVDFAYDGGGRGKGGTATLSVNGRKVAEGRIDHTNPIMFSADEAADVGVDEGTPVTEAYTSLASRFNGTIRKVTVEVR